MKIIKKKKFFVEIVPDRSKKTLEEVILRRIRPGTVILSDGWKSYNGIKNLGYGHHVINHSEHFVDPNNSDIHTQNI